MFHEQFTNNSFPYLYTLEVQIYHARSISEIKSSIRTSTNVYQGEKKKAEYEYLKQKQLQRQSQMEHLSLESKRESMELHRLSQELGFNGKLAGLQSEPTTPPEYRDSGFPTPLSRQNRFSMSNVVSPPASLNRRSFIEPQVSSPPSERARAYQALTAALPSSSNPDSRQNSDEDEYEEAIFEQNHRSAAA